MKKLFVIVAVVAMSVAACGKKKAPAAPEKKDMGSATAPAGDGSAAPAGDGSAAPAPGM